MSETGATLSDVGMLDRRGVLAGAAGALAFAAAGGALAAEKGAHPAGHAGHGAGKYAALAQAARVCVDRGETCVAHCLEEYRSGGNTLAVCATRVEEMLAACRGLAVLASLESAHLAQFAAACAEICKSCEAECRKHEEHEICRACADSCRDCIKACQALKSA
jgi:Cys-rich four helix bundle protein (predicted Tat secretion target)